MGFEALIGKVLYRKETVGGGDIKLFGALGFVLGGYGIIIVFVMATILAALHFLTLILRRKVKKGDYLPMVPYIAIATTVYLVFLWGLPEVYLAL
jgi:prepilin signal peptidase PulO-like enzyme (type II secretory pathway)